MSRLVLILAALLALAACQTVAPPPLDLGYPDDASTGTSE